MLQKKQFVNLHIFFYNTLYTDSENEIFIEKFSISEHFKW